MSCRESDACNVRHGDEHVKFPESFVYGHVLLRLKKLRVVRELSDLHSKSMFRFHLVLDAYEPDQRSAEVEPDEELEEETRGQEDRRLDAADESRVREKCRETEDARQREVEREQYFLHFAEVMSRQREVQ